jgi:hexosaminidase
MREDRGRRAALLAALCGLLTATGSGAALGAGSRGFSITWEVLGPQEGQPGLFRSRLTLVNHGPRRLGERGWALYFNSSRPLVPESLPGSVRVTHINGDFHKLEPTGSFAPLAPGQSLAVPLATREAIINVSGVPSGFYFVHEGEAAPEVVARVETRPLLKPEQTQRAAADRVPVPTPALRYGAQAGLLLAPAPRARVVPKPLRVEPRPGAVTLGPATEIRHAAGLEREAAVLEAALTALLGVKPRVSAGTTPSPSAVVLETGPLAAAGDEAYTLAVSAEAGITIRGAHPAGVFYGIQTLRALVPPEAYREPQASLTLEAVRIEDAPRFGYRGLMLDVARSFHPKASVLKLVDLMAFYKLNRLHLHLSDDEGWRLEIRPLPELTAIGARRGHTLDEQDRLVPSFGSGPEPERSHGSGHYTRADFVEILRYAAARHVEVIPEMDMPGHARAAIVAMRARPEHALHDPEDASVYRSVQGWSDNVLNVCQPSAYRFVATVVDEVAAMYAEAGVPLRTFHIGGDEVPAGAWERSPACARLLSSGAGVGSVAELHDHFVREVNVLLAKRRIVTGGWEEIALKRTTSHGRVSAVPKLALQGQVRPNVWNNVWGEGGEDHAYRLANAGYDVVMSHAANLYFDLAYDKDPEEPGQSWAGFTDARSAYEFAPFDLFQTARVDLMGAPINPRVAFKDHVRLNDEARGRILGLQGHLWSEYARDQEALEYLVFPKLLGLAERAWAPKPAWEGLPDEARRRALLDADWNEFANRLGQIDLPRLAYLAGGVHYRLPPPGAVVEAGQLKANVAFPGLTIRYTTDGTEPTADSPAYSGPVAVRGTVRLKAFAASARGSRTSVVSAPPAQASRVP